MSSYLDEIFGLTGRLAVVTGGSSGIGRAMAAALGRAGARIVLGARDPARLDETVAELTGHGVPAGAISADLADRAAVAATVDRIIAAPRGGNPEPRSGDHQAQRSGRTATAARTAFPRRAWSR